MERFTKIASVGEIGTGRSKSFGNGGARIAIFNADGAFFAVEDCCSADGWPLSEGTLIGSAVVCACDKALFYLPTGECLDPPHPARLAIYELRIVGNEIGIALEEERPRARLSRRDDEMDRPAV